MLDALPIQTAPRDGTWFQAIGPHGLSCRAHFMRLAGPSDTLVETLVSEFGGQIEATHWQPISV